MRIEVPYGEGAQVAELSYPWEVEEVHLRPYPGEPDEREEIERALDRPLDFDWGDLRGARSAVIVVSDSTRPVPNKLILPPLLERLKEAGLEPSRMKILVGTGLHRPASEEELRTLRDITGGAVEVISHNAYALGILEESGSSSQGTPIFINRHYLEAEMRVIVGMIDPHQIVGYSGGAKGVVIGCGGEATIRANHSLLRLPGSELGRVEGNPAREDIDDIGGRIGINLIVNVILDGRGRVARAVAGHYFKAHRKGVEIARQICEVPVTGPADLVIASAGGFPKDINLYQAQKGLAHATRIVKEGGTIILCAECREGAGDDRFVEAMREGRTVEGVLTSFASQEFRMGAHKAYLWCRSLKKARVILVSRGIDQDMAKIMQVTPAANLAEALQLAAEHLPLNARVAVLPKANSTIPYVKEA
ncbi:MAG: nickel-dependent lactate racemase [Thermanaeromonas sp.]|uniref:nickel-dependent lactate racemase n=1 Tax=Thermanaeromonas sp. TaxID=2003697 RepID=UPI00243A841D|nr:nickel-dependent lactate racemase [Thermanaeromonas sp.]MCG0278368.1 nickel-dependent lactate racemase [Thermanaeromonas sp.]